MKKTNFASMLAVAGGLAITTAACSAPAEEGATEADAMSVEDASEETGEETGEETAEGCCAAEGYCDAEGCCAAAECEAAE